MRVAQTGLSVLKTSANNVWTSSQNDETVKPASSQSIMSDSIAPSWSFKCDIRGEELLHFGGL